MLRKTIRIFFGTLLSLTVLSMVVGTFLEKNYSAQFAKEYIYNQLWFESIWLILAVYLLVKSLSFVRKKKINLLLLHFSILVILIGAGVTRYFGENGVFHVREHQSQQIWYELDESNKIKSEKLLPFSIELNEFIIETYPGSMMPSSYMSKVILVDSLEDVRFEYSIFMNHVLDYKGYRFYQTSFDDDHRGTILSVNHDPWGVGITYTGYLLLCISLFVSLLSPKNSFRNLLKHPVLLKPVKIILVLIFVGIGFSVQKVHATDIPSQLYIDQSVSEKYEQLWVEDGKGRFKPMQTLAGELLHKLTGSDKFMGLTASQFMIGLMMYEKEWNSIPVFRVKNDSLQRLIGINQKRASFNDFFDESGNYKLREYAINATKNRSTNSGYQKDIDEITELVSIYRSIQMQYFLRIFPDPLHTKDSWLSPRSSLKELKSNDSLFVKQGFNLIIENYISGNKKDVVYLLDRIQLNQKQIAGDVIPADMKRQIEIIYNKSNIFLYLFRVYSLIGFGLLILFLIRVFRNKEQSLLEKIGYTIIFVLMIVHAVFIAFRVYIAGYAPLSNGYETMLIISFLSIVFGVLFRKSSGFILPAATVFSAMVLMVANLNWMNPEITSLVPVLKSYWLSIHVSLMMVSYTSSGIAFILGIISMLLAVFVTTKNFTSIENLIQKISVLNKIFVVITLVFITIGVICGAVWANESWGAYWSWDPKETWALISLIVYALLTHFKSIKPLLYNALVVLSYSFILMTYFGVNYYLGGKHSYAGSADITFVSFVSAYLVIYVVLFFSSIWRFNKISANF